MSKAEQILKITRGKGFIAALDQSGGSTPKALKLYGLDESTYETEEEMFDLMHSMRARIATAPQFTGDNVIGAILFEQTMEREIEGIPSAQYFWEQRQIVPFLKVDKGLEAEENQVQLLKDMPALDEVLDRANEAGMFGAKMRSVVKGANEVGIKAIAAQQFEFGTQIQGHSLVPIIEPEIDIHAPDKAEAEQILLSAILDELEDSNDQPVIIKLTIPEVPNTYAPLLAHPKVMRVIALSGGYSRDEAVKRLSENEGMIASFSRGLTQGLSAQQSDDEFNTTLSATIDKIAAASNS